MSPRITIPALALSACCVLAACSGSGSTGTSSTPTPSASANGGDAGCTVASVDGQSSNAQVQQLATAVYNELDCASATPLIDQLKAAGSAPALKQQVKAAGATMQVTEAGGGVSLSIVKGTTGCTVVTLDSPKGKTLGCA